MRRKLISGSLSIVVALLVFAGGTAVLVAPVAAAETAVAAKSREMSVQVRQAAVRGEPSALAAPLFMLSYGDRVQVTGEVGDWAVLRLPDRDKPAYMYLASLSAKRIGTSSPSYGPAQSGVSAPELALAGKGFETRVEEDYGMRAHLDFTFVDCMEALGFDPVHCASFLAGAE